MNRYQRAPKKKSTPKEEENDSDDLFIHDKTPVRAPAFPIEMGLTSHKPLGRPHQTDEEKQEVYLHLIALKKNGKTHKECAAILEVSERTIANYLSDPYYLELYQEQQVGAKQRGHAIISDLAPYAIRKLWDLMYGAKSEFVQYKSAEYLLKTGGYEIEQEQRQLDTKSELEDFLAKLEKRATKNTTTITVHMPSPSAGTPYVVEASENPSVSSSRSEYAHEDNEGLSEASQMDELPERYRVPMLPGGRLPRGEEGEEERG